jgi:glycosyltransferase involved in cell wall biosynthesis
MSEVRLAIVNTHPIQYYSPYYRELASRNRLEIRVFYSWRGPLEDAHDPGFDQTVSWDIPLLDGYNHTFVENTATDPGTHHFRGIIAPDLIPKIEAWAPDALLVFGWNVQAHFRVLRHFYGKVPILFRGDSTLLDETVGPRKWVRRIFLRWVYKYVDHALYVGKSNRAYFEAHGLQNDELTWVPHAIDNKRFADADNADKEARQWRRELGIQESEQVILFAGKLESKKAPDVLIEAYLGLDDADTHLVVVGSGQLEDELIDRVGDHPRVHFLGFQNQSRMPVVYRIGDLFVLPSRGPGETWGLGVNEAMACGRPVVVSSKVGCAPDLVDETNGAIIPPDDPTAFRDALRNLLADREQLREMGHCSAERIRKWSIDEAASRTVAAVRSVVAGSGYHVEEFLQ